MIKQIIISMVSIGLIASPAYSAERRDDSVKFPNGRSDWDVSDRVAKEVFWQFINCVAERDPEGANALLLTAPIKNERFKAARKLARDNSLCLGRNSNTMQFSEEIMFSAVAGIVLGRKNNAAVPDFTTVGVQFPSAALATFEDRDKRLKYAMGMFAECVIRTSPQASYGFLASDLFSPDAAKYLQQLSDPMSYCLPAEEGDSLELDRFKLRVSFGWAALSLEYPEGGWVSDGGEEDE